MHLFGLESPSDKGPYNHQIPATGQREWGPQSSGFSVPYHDPNNKMFLQGDTVYSWTFINL